MFTSVHITESDGPKKILKKLIAHETINDLMTNLYSVKTKYYIL